jgi:glycosyltransferase involved in cell wall biosynthesis
MDNVSVIIITHEEAHNIEACLRSIQGASEIILVDQNSSDGTANIASGLGARVFQEEWKGFAAQKNSALDKTEYPWILSLDADERLTPELLTEIQAVTHSDTSFDGYFIKRKNFFCGKWIRHSGWYPDYSLRLFRKNAGRFQERAVHERVVVHGRTGHLEHPLEHYTYRSISDYIQRMDRYSGLAAREMASGGRKTGLWISLIFRPLFTFLKMYVLRKGAMDGRSGLFLAVSYAYYTFLKYYKLSEEDPAERRETRCT